jgi:hypothetical protein
MMLAEWDPRAEDDQLSFSFDFPAAGAEAKPSEPAQG